MSAAPSDRPRRPCPICGRAGVVEWRPFCSRRCADVDLGRWMVGAYAVPGALAEEPDEGTGEGGGGDASG